MKEHSKLDFYNKKRVIVTMLQIVKLVHMRVGKEQYARENKSYGISSLKKSHLKIINDIIRFNFKGKSRKQLSYTLRNKNIQNHLELLLKLEGEKLFQYIDDNNKIHIMNYKDLNEYIQEFMGKDFY
jgi:DNA topoisomerase-1